ncbi:universal stress protein [Candidatus Leptofilum sp.]|uniref:universal stress protein n=1 Tax=Candidatus Leptofilum sp. TaxID=3241576 RepID=UPI003B593E5A
MGSIVCATRGGEGSRAAQMAAIERAKTLDKPLIFLYVVDPHSLDDDIDASMKDALFTELNWMGETLLRIAQKRADAAYLGTEVRIRKGKVRDEITRFVKDAQAELLVLGAPRGTTANVFGDDAIERLAEWVEAQTAVSVEIVRPDYVNNEGAPISP